MEKSPTNSRVALLHSGVAHGLGKCVVYIMGRDQRVHDNHALLAAQAHAIEKKLPLAVAFCLLHEDQVSSREQYDFMLDGLRQVESELKSLGIPFMMFFGDPAERMKWFAHHVQPASVYVDFSPLQAFRRLHERLALALEAPLYVVDTHNIVPVWQASNKQEVSARTLRPKIHKLLEQYVHAPQPVQPHPYAWPGVVMPISALSAQIDALRQTLPRNNVQYVWQSGEVAAHGALEEFIQNRLQGYALARNDPSVRGMSDLSPYLHFGQLSSLTVVTRLYEVLAEHETLRTDIDALVEEMVVRKELSDNFCYYSPQHRTLAAAPAWARATLAKHVSDPREYVYTVHQFEQAQTHDPAWNAAQRQLTRTGKMHGYMRMYWAKKVLEWSESPQQALDALVYLNDFYSIDGNDPNGYVGILWSVAGLHDRPWAERPVYGTVRSMVYNGLKRKFDVQSYIVQNS